LCQLGKLFKNSKLSGYRVKKIIRCFCIDIEASKAAALLDINRNAVHPHQTALKEKLVGGVEVDESHFGVRRARGF